MKYAFIALCLLLMGCTIQKNIFMKNCQLVGTSKAGDRISQCDGLEIGK